MFNSFGNIFRLTSFGESHGKGVGGVIDGFPAGIVIDEEFVQQELNRRRPGQSILTTARKEADKVEFLGINITAYTSQVGPIKLEGTYSDYDLDLIETNDVRCPDPEKAKEMADLIYKVKGEGDTIGGTLTCVIKGCPIGLGQPVFGKLHAALGNAMLSINAAKAFEYGEGFKGLKMKGSEQNDVFYNNNGRIETHTNHSGGIQGGLSNGQDIYFRVVFKPIATLLMEQETVNIDGIDTTLKARGRHDACVLPRAVPIVEAMAAMTILDYYLLDKTTQL